MRFHFLGGELLMNEWEKALYVLLVRLADNKYALGTRYHEWSNGGALSEASTVVSDMAQTELQHAESLYLLAHDLAPIVPSQPIDRIDRAVLFLIHPFRTHLDFIASAFLFDRAMSMVFIAALDSVYQPLAKTARLILQEEQFHTTYADGWVRNLSSEGGPMAKGIQEAIRSIWDDVLCWYGPQEDKQNEILYDSKTLDAMPNVLRARLLSQIGPISVAAHLALPLKPAERGNTWELTMPLPWHQWNALMWRLEKQSYD
jgi:1,2-phenylacetyl-CoA epoxidase catalytic subunit